MLNILLLISFFVYPAVQSEKLIELFKWKQIEFEQNTNSDSDFVFPDQINHHGNNRNNQGQINPQFDYIAYNNVPMGVTHHKGRLFITIPRRRPGIPATLNYISLSSHASNPSPKLNAYPNYARNKLQTHPKQGEETFVSVYRTTVDACNRLWFVDTGMLEYPGNMTQVQQPSIWLYDLKTNSKIHRIEIPFDVVNDGRGLASITIDVDSDNCGSAFGYIPDLYLKALYVYSLQQNRIWTFTHNYFSFNPLLGDFNIAGQRFQWSDGIFSITLGNKNPNGFRAAYFHPMASVSEFNVSTEVLRNELNAARSYHGQDFKFLGNRGPLKQSTKHAYEPKTGIIMYAEMANSGIGCWNTHKKLLEQNYVTLQRDEKRMIYPSDVMIDSDGIVWMMTNSMPLFIYSSLDPNQYNFRVWTQTVEKLIENTACDISICVDGNHN